MSQIWLYLLVIMVGGSVAKYLFASWVAWVIIDLVVFGLCYLVLKRYPYINMKKSLLFLGGLTLINILVDVGLLGGMAANLVLLLIIGWLLFGNSSNRPPNIRHKWHK
ncbi:hypothetical protein [Thermosinus carboxydivorans]|uniref:hypothetical protein n=1 Tax=Thermosinus carboxydivorans TaxID=261685 RepID=UPI0002F47FE3|nr:hypothetical protein [Thermosinus carboxydivorans]